VTVSQERQFKPLPTARKLLGMWAAPLPLPIRRRSRHSSIAEPEPQIPANAGDNHIAGEPTLGKQWIRIRSLSQFDWKVQMEPDKIREGAIPREGARRIGGEE
jgi:hypothetical protein